ncbi:sensor histidine kinase [Gracilimonas sediminicola]|uniref:histidine kinase n=1 Tax=Gracilimonas sediminicola TaxID=2952158 RepID=A0A9X2L378_9BACT|nr:sensor histidine kinase [Gracilimonas sediminicola]MCP9291452.1 sensor histidine kinase [Gracilimonas sediminicola]
MTVTKEQRITIESVKTKLIDSFVLYGAIIAFIAFLIPQIPFNPGNLNLFNYIDLTVIISVFILYYNRAKVSLFFKGGFILVAVYLFFVADLYQHGLNSTIRTVFVLIPFLGILVFEVRWAALFFFISILTYFIIAYGYLAGYLSPGLLGPELNTPTKWIIHGIILSLVSMIIAMFVHIFNKSLIKIIKQQDQSYKVLEQQDLELKQNIEEKNVLLQEIHHRVKNNLAVVSGLLDLQSGLATDEFSRSALKLSTNRILSISKVHELIYQSEDVSRIHLKKYIKELADIIIESFNKAGREIDLRLDINIQYLNVNHGVPVGIILNELITNSLKHGFNEAQESCQIQISAFEEDEHYKLFYQDNGSGFVDHKPEKLTGLGITLVDSLLTQIEAESQLKTDGLYQLSFRFPKELS